MGLRKNGLVLTGLICLVAARLCAQNPTVTVPLTTASIQIVPVESRGFVVMDLSGPRINDEQVALALMHFNIDLQQKWSNVLPITRGLQMQHYEVFDDYLIMAFADRKQQYLEVYRVDILQGHFQKSIFQFANSFNLDNMAASPNKLWASGTMSNQGVLFNLDEGSNRAHILPTAYSSKVLGIRELDFEPERGLLSFLILTNINKSQSYVWRSLEVAKNRVVQNLELTPPSGLQLTQARTLREGSRRYVVGTCFKKNPEQALGLFFYELHEGEEKPMQVTLFKEHPELNQYLLWSDGDEPRSQTRKISNFILIDQVGFHDSDLFVTMELLEKRYQAKGALQQELERNELVTNLDQNRYGRRGLDQSADENQTVEDRISQRSATDILQYRYRNALVAQPTFEGLGLDRNLWLKFDPQLNLKHCQSIKTGNEDLLYLGTSNTFTTDAGVHQFYDSGKTYHTWLYRIGEAGGMDYQQIPYSDVPARVFRLSSKALVVTQLNQEPAGYLLVLKKVVLGETTDRQ